MPNKALLDYITALLDILGIYYRLFNSSSQYVELFAIGIDKDELPITNLFL